MATHSSILAKRIPWTEEPGMLQSILSQSIWHDWSDLACMHIYVFRDKNQFSSVTQSCLTLCNPMDCGIPGLPVHCQLPEFTQTHVHWISDAIQPFHPLSSPSPPAFNLSQHQGLFQWVSSLHQVAKVLEFQLQHQSFQLICFRRDWLDLLAVQGLSRVFFNTTVEKHQFFNAQLSL